MLVQQLQHIVDDLVLGLCQQVRVREDCVRNLGTGILAAKLGDDVVEVLECTPLIPVPAV